jgi:hypothetical protein
MHQTALITARNSVNIELGPVHDPEISKHHVRPHHAADRHSSLSLQTGEEKATLMATVNGTVLSVDVPYKPSPLH